MWLQNISPEFRLKNIDETIEIEETEEIEQNELMSNKHKKVFTTLNYTEHLFQLLQLLDVFQFLLLILYLVFLKELRVLQ